MSAPDESEPMVCPICGEEDWRIIGLVDPGDGRLRACPDEWHDLGEGEQ